MRFRGASVWTHHPLGNGHRCCGAIAADVGHQEITLGTFVLYVPTARTHRICHNRERNISPYSMSKELPQVPRSLLAQAAQMAGISLMAISADETPWHTSLPPHQSQLWAGALAELDPSAAEAMQKTHGQPVSMALQMALDGEAELTTELVGEWQSKRPAEYRAHKARAIDEALGALEAKRAARRAREEEQMQERTAAERQARHASAELARLQLRGQAQARSGQW
jgi:hypothetical protein